MKNYELFAKYMRSLAIRFKITPTDDFLNIYWDEFEPYSDDTMEHAFKQIFNEKLFIFPSPLEIVQLAQKIYNEKSIEKHEEVKETSLDDVEKALIEKIDKLHFKLIIKVMDKGKKHPEVSTLLNKIEELIPGSKEITIKGWENIKEEKERS